MPTYEDPRRDEDELAEAGRGLAYATRRIDAPAEMYDVLGSVQLSLTRLQQSLQQLADHHLQHAASASTAAGDRLVGHDHAVKAGGWLTIAAATVPQVTDLVRAAYTETGHITWQAHPASGSLQDAVAVREAELDPGASTVRGREHTGEGLGR